MSSEHSLRPEQQAVIGWLKSVRNAGGVSAYKGRAEQLRHDLMQRLDALPVRVPGQIADAVTLLYSGPLGDQTKGGWEIAESIGYQSNGLVVTIGETPLGILQNHKDFDRALLGAVGDENSHLHKELMYGTRPDGSRVESVWDRASRRPRQTQRGQPGGAGQRVRPHARDALARSAQSGTGCMKN